MYQVSRTSTRERYAEQPTHTHTQIHTYIHTIQTYMHTQARDGSQLKGSNGQPSGIRLRLAYASLQPDGSAQALPLPLGWEKKVDAQNRTFYVNHTLKTFSWTPPPLYSTDSRAPVETKIHSDASIRNAREMAEAGTTEYAPGNRTPSPSEAYEQSNAEAERQRQREDRERAEMQRQREAQVREENQRKEAELQAERERLEQERLRLELERQKLEQERAERERMMQMDMDRQRRAATEQQRQVLCVFVGRVCACVYLSARSMRLRAHLCIHVFLCVCMRECTCKHTQWH